MGREQMNHDCSCPGETPIVDPDIILELEGELTPESLEALKELTADAPKCGSCKYGCGCDCGND